jgi:hypothetical protein
MHYTVFNYPPSIFHFSGATGATGASTLSLCVRAYAVVVVCLLLWAKQLQTQ